MPLKALISYSGSEKMLAQYFHLLLCATLGVCQVHNGTSLYTGKNDTGANTAQAGMLSMTKIEIIG